MGGRTAEGLIVAAVMLLILASVTVVPMMLVKPADRDEQEGPPQ